MTGIHHGDEALPEQRLVVPQYYALSLLLEGGPWVMDRTVTLPGVVVPTAEIPIAAGVVLAEVLAALVAEETTEPAVEPVWLENYL